MVGEGGLPMLTAREQASAAIATRNNRCRIMNGTVTVMPPRPNRGSKATADSIPMLALRPSVRFRIMATSQAIAGVSPSGYRLPGSTHVGRVRLRIANLHRSLSFYQSVLGLRVIDRSTGRAVMGPAGGGAAILELEEKPDAKPLSRRGHIGLYHFAVLLPTRQALGQFLQHISELGVHAGMSDHFVSEAIYLQDPDGLGIEVYADRPRSAWRYDQDKQISMTTAPLNVQDLLRATGGTQWSGAPAGTTIGHIHLHVRDLAKAEAFYHEALGLDKVVWNYPGALFLSAGGYHHHLGTNTWAAASPTPSEDDARLIDWELVLPSQDELQRVEASLTKHGYATTQSGGALFVNDPWGTTLRLVVP